MQETVPDSVFEKADEVELVDLPPDELLERLHAGKVYIPEQARNAIENFFRKGNLIALRELALRTTADRVDAAMQRVPRGQGDPRDLGGGRAHPGGDRPRRPGASAWCAPASAWRPRCTRDWIVVYVETPDLLRLSDEERNRRIALLRLAESLGAEAVTLGGSSAGEALANYARERNVTRILIGRPRRAAVAAPVPALHLRRAARRNRGRRHPRRRRRRRDGRAAQSRSSRAAGPTSAPSRRAPSRAGRATPGAPSRRPPARSSACR